MMIYLRRLLLVPLLFGLGVAEAAAQQGQGVSGRVVNAETLAPLVGAIVLVEGSSVRSVTGPDGRYSIQAPSNGTLLFSLLGYPEHREAVQGRAVINVSLQPAALQLDELVVVGYGTQTRATVSGSVSSIDSDDINTASFSSTSDALAGLVQGINVRMMTSNGTQHTAGQAAAGNTGGQIAGSPNDGRPGSASSLQIRNMGDPLYVIDGIPSGAQEFNNLNANDIENISILKDASAAVYGFRASNGVVLVTTKKGDREQAPRVTVDANYGWQNPTRYHFQNNLNAYEYIFARSDSDQNLGQSYLWSKDQMELWRQGGPGYESTDHYPLVFNNPNAPTYRMNASVSGGGQNVQYYLSLGQINQEYALKGFDWGRTNLSTNLSVDLSDRFRVGTEIRGQNAVRDQVALSGDQDPIRTALLGIHSQHPYQQPWTGANNELINYAVARPERSIALIDKDISGYSIDVDRQIAGNFWAEYSFPFGTTLRATYSRQLDTRDYDLVRKTYSAYREDANNPGTYNLAFTSADRARQQLKNRVEGEFANVTLSHSQDFGVHGFSGAVFSEIDGSDNNQTYLIGNSPTNYTHLIEQSLITEIGNSWSASRRASVGGRVDYDYDEKYLLSLVGRYDGSYLYNPDSRWGFFPGVSLGWRVTEEDFFSDRLGFLDDLKLRASWGQTGREQATAYGYLAGATYGVGNGSILDGVMVEGVRPRGLPATNLSWLTSTSKNVGFDAIFMDGRLSIEADLFERVLDGIPAGRSDVLLPNELGYGLPNENLNADATRGFEAALTWGSNAGRVQYSVSPNLTIARSMPTKRYRQRFANAWDQYRNGGLVGRWEGTNFGYEVIGQFKSMEEIESHPVMFDGQGNVNLLPGDLIFKDQNGDGIINDQDARPIGFGINQTPILSFGMGSQISFQGITVQATFAGGGMYSHNRDFEMRVLSQGGHNMAKYALDRWHRADPYNPRSEWIPGRYPPLRINATGGRFPSTSLNSTFYRTNVKFLRVRNIQVAYSLPDDLPTRVGLSNVRIFSNLTNPLSYDNTRHYSMDPEVTQNTGIVYPTIRQLNVGFSANLGGRPDSAVPVPVGSDD